jgi:N,N'-diacetyllegionaminate synthase
MNSNTSDNPKKRRTAAIVSARMDSSRLPKKAILPIHGKASIERCLENCLKIPSVDDVILATSTLKEDSILADYTLEGRVKFWRGDPVDVISRYLGACGHYGIGLIIRVTGDCPVISPKISEFLMESHLSSGADFTEPRRFAVGTNSQVYNVEALEKVIQIMGRAEYSEHMTFYMTSNPHIFKLNIVDLPDEWIRDYRLTLDYQEDLDMFNALFKKLEETGRDGTLLNVFQTLEDNPDIPKINAHKTLVYKTDKGLIKMLKQKTRIDQEF